jgi:hypothetical protein
VPDYLPLCAFRQGLLPEACRSCAWWQSVGADPRGEAAVSRRRAWLPSVEQHWGSAGILVYDSPSRFGSSGLSRAVVSASVHFAPALCVPRFRALGFSPLPDDAALLFCLRLEENAGRSSARRLVIRALAELRDRGVDEAYAVAGPYAESIDDGTCRFFSSELLAACGFEHVAHNGTLALMRTDLRGLLTLIDQFEATVRRMLRTEPTPSPAAWSRQRALSGRGSS